MFQRLPWLTALAVWLVLYSIPATGEGLTLQQALDRALADNPTVEAEIARAESLRQQGVIDTLPPAWQVTADLEQFAGTGSLRGLRGAESTIRLGRQFELGGKRASRIALADARVAAQEHEQRLSRLDLEALVTQRFYTVLAGQALIDLSQRELQLARETLEVVRLRVDRGVSPGADQPLAELEVARAALVLEDAEHELESARVALSVLWGEREPAFAAVVGTLAPESPGPRLGDLESALQAGADLHRYALEAKRLDAEGQLAAAAMKPDLLGTVGVRRLEGIDDQALVISVSVPFGAAGRGALAASRVRADKNVLAARREAEELDLHQTLYGLYQEMQHALHEAETLRLEMIPAAERALDLAVQGYESARYSFLHVADTRRVLHTLQRDQIDASIRYHQLTTRIQRLTAASEGALP